MKHLYSQSKNDRRSDRQNRRHLHTSREQLDYDHNLFHQSVDGDSADVDVDNLGSPRVAEWRARRNFFYPISYLWADENSILTINNDGTAKQWRVYRGDSTPEHGLSGRHSDKRSMRNSPGNNNSASAAGPSSASARRLAHYDFVRELREQRQDYVEEEYDFAKQMRRYGRLVPKDLKLTDEEMMSYVLFLSREDANRQRLQQMEQDQQQRLHSSTSSVDQDRNHSTDPTYSDPYTELDSNNVITQEEKDIISALELSLREQ